MDIHGNCDIGCPAGGDVRKGRGQVIGGKAEKDNGDQC